MRNFLGVMIFSLLLFNPTAGQEVNLSRFVSDTLKIQLSVDSLTYKREAGLTIIDSRDLPGDLIGIQQVKRWRYIPVDQYIVLHEPLINTLKKYYLKDSCDFKGTLDIKNLTLWKDKKPVFSKGRKLNCYTILIDSSGNAISDWMWEFTVKKKRKQKDADVIAELIDQLMSKQIDAIKQKKFHHKLYPYFYRRQLINWYDLIFLKDGMIIIGHLTLDFPPDQMKKYVRGSPGIYYRKSSFHESIAIGGMDQHWYSRINKNFSKSVSFSYRFGFNNFNSDKFSHLDFWNIFLINIGLSASIEYRPVYHRGIFLGIGLYGSINVLPDVISRFEPGLLFTSGVLLP